MTSTAAHLRLMSWLSPAFPTGGFAYSAGLEHAVAVRRVTGSPSLAGWCETQLFHGALWNDALLFAAAWRAAHAGEDVTGIADLAAALAPGAERNAETMAQGHAFSSAARHWPGLEDLGADLPLPVAVGWASGRTGIDLEHGLGGFVHAFLSNQLQAAIRLSVVGQNGAAALLARLEPAIADQAQRAARATLDDLGGSAIMADIASLEHETQQPRLFLS